MWNISCRKKINDWEELGSVADLKAAVEFLLKRENSKDFALFFSCYVDCATDFAGKDDAELLSRLEYRTDRWLYLVTRVVQ